MFYRPASVHRGAQTLAEANQLPVKILITLGLFFYTTLPSMMLSGIPEQLYIVLLYFVANWLILTCRHRALFVSSIGSLFLF